MRHEVCEFVLSLHLLIFVFYFQSYAPCVGIMMLIDDHLSFASQTRHMLEELRYQVKSLIGSQFSFVKCKVKEESRSNLDGVPTVKEDSVAHVNEFSSQQVAVPMVG